MDANGSLFSFLRRKAARVPRSPIDLSPGGRTGGVDALGALPVEHMDRISDGLNEALLAEGKAVGRLLDWIGVAGMSPLRERVLILCAEHASRTGQMPFDEAMAKGREVLDA